MSGIFALIIANTEYDMAGNASEWVADWYSDTYYASSPTINPPGPIFLFSGQGHILRGGSWNLAENAASTTNRFSAEPSTAHDDIGFRCSRSISP